MRIYCFDFYGKCHSFSLKLPRGGNHQRKLTSDPAELVNENPSQLSEAVPDAGHPVDSSRSTKVVEYLSQAADGSFHDKRHGGNKVLLFINFNVVYENV